MFLLRACHSRCVLLPKLSNSLLVLQGNLVLHLMVAYTLRGQRKQVQLEHRMAEKPLYAKLVSIC